MMELTNKITIKEKSINFTLFRVEKYLKLIEIISSINKKIDEDVFF